MRVRGTSHTAHTTLTHAIVPSSHTNDTHGARTSLTATIKINMGQTMASHMLGARRVRRTLTLHTHTHSR